MPIYNYYYRFSYNQEWWCIYYIMDMLRNLQTFKMKNKSQQSNIEVKIAIIILVATFILMFAMSYKCKAQAFNRNENMILSDSIVRRQKLLFDITCNYRQYEYHQDRAMMFGIITGLMWPCIFAFSNSVNHKDNLGKAFYGAYSVIDIGAAAMCIGNLIKADRIKNRKFKNK